MSEDELRALMKRKFEAMPLREWCRLTNCAPSHVSEFVRGMRAPPHDMLRALNLRVAYIRNRKAKDKSERRLWRGCGRVPIMALAA